MRAVVLTAAYPSPSEPERAVHVETLTRRLARGAEGVDPVRVSVVAPRVRPEDPLREERSGIPVRRFAYPSRGRRLKEIERPSPLLLAAYAASGTAALLDEVRARAADLVLCHWVLPAGPIAFAASALLRVPYAVVAHGSDVNRYARASRLLRIAARRVLGGASLAIAVSEALRRELIEGLGVPPGKTAVLPMGVDEEVFGPGPSVPGEAGAEGAGAGSRAAARAALGLDRRAPLLLFVGDLVREKGVPELLEATGALARRGLEVTLCLAGDGPLHGGRAPAAAPIRFLGRVPQRELAAWYHAADLLVLPSWAEGSPVVVLEAAACGLPVVASRVGGLPETVEDGVTGWLTPPRDAAALASTLERLLRDGAPGGALDAARRRLLESRRDVSAGRRAAELRGMLEEVVHGA